MNAERDEIKYNVIPRLNHYFREHGIEIQAIDLRYGINTEDMTEEESEDAVLEVCMSMIESSRPFFIALLGARYGWIPNETRFESVLSRLSTEKRHLIIEGKNCSVTELEILYGAIGSNGENIDHSAFFVRTPESYKEIPIDKIESYVEKDTFKQKKLGLLRERVYTLLSGKGRENLYIPYSSKWNGEFLGGLEDFSNKVFDYLCNQISSELPASPQEIKWHEYARNANISQLARNLRNAVDLYGIPSFLEKIVKHNRVLLSGSMGTGKSILLSQLYYALKEDEEYMPLISIITATPYLGQMNNLLFIWIREMEQELRLDEETDEQVLEKPDAYRILNNRFYSLKDKFQEIGRIVVVLVDGLESLCTRENTAANLQWAINGLKIICTCTSGTYIYNKIQANTEIEIFLDERRPNIKEVVISNEKRYNINLPSDVDQMMENDKVSPMFVRLFMTITSYLNSQDFAAIDTTDAKSEIEKSNRYITGLYHKVPKDPAAAFSFALDFISERMSAKWLRNAVCYLANSGSGLRTKDLSSLIGEYWDELKFTLFMNIFDCFFSEDSITKLWTLNSSTIRDGLIENSYAIKLCTALAGYPDDDSLKLSNLLYYAILSCDTDIIEKYLCADSIYDSEDYFKFMSDEGVQLLLERPNHIGLVSALLEKLQPVSQVRLLDAITRFMSILLRDEWYLEFGPRLSGLHAFITRAEDLYSLATFIYYTAMRIKENEGLRWELIDSAYLTYKKCYETDSSYADIKNSYKMAIIKKATVLSEKGHIDEAMELLLSIDKI